MGFKGEMADKIARLASERGIKPLRINLPASEPEVDPSPLEVERGLAAAVPVAACPGDLIVEFEVNMRPCPWKAPSTTRTGHAYKDPTLVKWQDEVRRCGKEAMNGREPYAGPVELRFLFSLIRKPGSPPDLSNLVKSCEDGIQKCVIVNDSAVLAIASRRTFGDRDFARVTVLAMEPERKGK